MWFSKVFLKDSEHSDGVYSWDEGGEDEALRGLELVGLHHPRPVHRELPQQSLKSLLFFVCIILFARYVYSYVYHRLNRYSIYGVYKLVINKSCVFTVWVREAGKKVLILMAGPLRLYPPPPLGLNGHRIYFVIFFSHKIARSGFFFLPPIFGQNSPIFWEIL